jgi:uncharacterized repeat protein (TIGR03847 family)
MSGSVEFEAPDRFATCAEGPPGQRVFYLQARQAGRLVTLKLEKEHVRALARHLVGLLARITREPGDAPGEVTLLEPVDPAWSVGSLGVGYDRAAGRIVVVASEELEEAEESREPAAARFAITPGQATAFIQSARTLMAAGRPVCPVCGDPMDPGGHVCPRSNGHVVRRD